MSRGSCGYIDCFACIIGCHQHSSVCLFFICKIALLIFNKRRIAFSAYFLLSACFSHSSSFLLHGTKHPYRCICADTEELSLKFLIKITKSGKKILMGNRMLFIFIHIENGVSCCLPSLFPQLSEQQGNRYHSPA